MTRPTTSNFSSHKRRPRRGPFTDRCVGAEARCVPGTIDGRSPNHAVTTKYRVAAPPELVSRNSSWLLPCAAHSRGQSSPSWRCRPADRSFQCPTISRAPSWLIVPDTHVAKCRRAGRTKRSGPGMPAHAQPLDQLAGAQTGHDEGGPPIPRVPQHAGAGRGRPRRCRARPRSRRTAQSPGRRHRGKWTTLSLPTKQPWPRPSPRSAVLRQRQLPARKSCPGARALTVNRGRRRPAPAAASPQQPVASPPQARHPRM